VLSDLAGRCACTAGSSTAPVSSEAGAFSWLSSSRRQALILLAYCTVSVARPNVRVEAGPAVLHLARAVHHVPQAPRGQGAMPLGLASNEGLGLARRATAWTCEDFVISGAFPFRGGEGGAACIRTIATLDCPQTHQCRTERTN